MNDEKILYRLVKTKFKKYINGRMHFNCWCSVLELSVLSFFCIIVSLFLSLLFQVVFARVCEKNWFLRHTKNEVLLKCLISSSKLLNQNEQS